MSSLFETSQKGFQALEDSTVSSTDEEFQAKVKTLHSNFCKVAHITSSLALFSPNETLEDITTPSLKYVAFFLLSFRDFLLFLEKPDIEVPLYVAW